MLHQDVPVKVTKPGAKVDLKSDTHLIRYGVLKEQVKDHTFAVRGLSHYKL